MEITLPRSCLAPFPSNLKLHTRIMNLCVQKQSCSQDVDLFSTFPNPIQMLFFCQIFLLPVSELHVHTTTSPPFHFTAQLSTLC